MTRDVGECLLIDDVVVTVTRVNEEYAEVSLQKQAGGPARVATLPRKELVDACYDTQVVFIESRGTKARLGIEYPEEIAVTRC